MNSQIKCTIHNDEDIIFIDISQFAQNKNRSYCVECLRKIQLENTCSYKKIPDIMAQCSQNIIEGIAQKQQEFKVKIKKTMKLIDTLKEKTMQIFDDILLKHQKILEEMEITLAKEKEYYENLIIDITRTKLEQIAEILSGNNQKIQQLPNYLINQQVYLTDIAQQFKTLVSLQSDLIKQINDLYSGKIKLQSQLKQQQNGYALAFNQNQNMIVGGRGKDIVIWQQNQFELKEISVLKGHTDYVNAIVLYQSGDMIVSGGSIKDKQIKLWRKQNNEWNCIQTINDHNARIIDLQLSKNQEQLISASVDKLIKIWRMKQPNYYLECIQTIDDQTNCVCWITISQDFIFMASSSSQNYFNIYKNEQSKVNPWKKFNKIGTKGEIKRVYFTNNDELLVQQVDPPLLIVYSKNTNNQYQAKQDIVLSQPDNQNILFPIFEINNTIYLKNDNYVYIIRRSKTGKYLIQQILPQLCASGCRDCTGEGIILWNYDNKSIDIYK